MKETKAYPEGRIKRVWHRFLDSLDSTIEADEKPDLIGIWRGRFTRLGRYIRRKAENHGIYRHRHATNSVSYGAAKEGAE